MTEDFYEFVSDTLIQKSETDDYYEIEGICSTGDQDIQNEIILQNGLDLSLLQSGKGFFNADHGRKYQNKDQARMGLIDVCELRPEGLYIKGKIFKSHPEAAIYLNELKYGRDVVKFSIEGRILSKSKTQDGKKLIKKALVTGVALTRNPVNTNTYAALAKSLFIEDESNTDIENSEEIEKGGIGSGRKRIKPLLEDEGDKEKKKTQNEESSGKKTVIVDTDDGQQNKKENTSSSSSSSDTSGDKQSQEIKEQEEETTRNKKESEKTAKVSRDRTKEKRDAMYKEIRDARSSYSGKDLEERLIAIKLKYTGKRKRKKEEEIKKSISCDIIFDMIQKDPDFANQVREILLKGAVESGGPVQTTTLPQDMSGSEVFQESNLDKKKKKKKDKEQADNK